METNSYKPPTNLVKVDPDDTGYKLVRRNYRRWTQTFAEFGKKYTKLGEEH